MYVCMYVCMCVHVWAIRKEGRLVGLVGTVASSGWCSHVSTCHRSTYICIYIYIYCMYVCMYVCAGHIYRFTLHMGV